MEKPGRVPLAGVVVAAGPPGEVVLPSGGLAAGASQGERPLAAVEGADRLLLAQARLARIQPLGPVTRLHDTPCITKPTFSQGHPAAPPCFLPLLLAGFFA